MRKSLLWIGLGLVALAVPALADVFLKDFGTVGTITDTDNTFWCQVSGGCGSTDPLKRVTALQLVQYILPKITGGDFSVASSGAGTLSTTVNASPGTYTNANITVNNKGLVTAAANGTGGTGGIVAGTTTVTGTCPSGQTLINNAGVVGCQAAGGGGTVTNVSVAPGLTTAVGTENTGANAITTTGTISPQRWPVAVSASCSVNTNCNGAVTNETGELLIASAASVTFTLPNPAASTKGNGYCFGSDGGHGYTLTTTSTGTFYGDLGSGTGARPYTVPAKTNLCVADDGTNYQVEAYGVTGGVPVTIGAPVNGACTAGYNLANIGGVVGCQANGSGGGLTCDAGFTATLGACVWTKAPAADATNCGSNNCIVFNPAGGLNQNRYTLRCSNLMGAATADIGVQYHLSGGTWQTSGYVGAQFYNNAANGNTLNALGNVALPDIRLVYFPKSGAQANGAAIVEFNDLQNAVPKTAFFRALDPQNDGTNNYMQIPHGAVAFTTPTTAVDQIRITDVAGVGSITSGSCTLTEVGS